jgi:hypothetical protein
LNTRTGKKVNLLPISARALSRSIILFAALTTGWVIGGEPLNAESKKGLQVQLIDDAMALGIHHAAVNVNLLQLATINDLPSAETLVVEGKTYAFNRRCLDELDSKVKPLSQHGVIVYLILLVYPYNHPDLDRAFVNAKYNPACPFHCAAFRTDDEAAARRFRANVSFLAQRYALPNGPPVHFIVGNEINSHWYWFNMGDAKMEAVAEEYERAVRLTHEALRPISKTSRVFISLDQNWAHGFDVNAPTRCFGGRPFLEYFNRLVKSKGDFPRHLTTHPYPENMFDSRTWNDKTVTRDDSTHKITFKNLEVATDYMKRPEMLFEGKPRRIVLAEQGFHTIDAPDGELLQAAAFAYSYYKVAKLDGIDAFIYHRHVDHGLEGGLNLGLWSRDKAHPFPAQPLKKKQIYDVFRRADTADWQEAFRFALPVIGIKDWSEIK